VRRITLVHTNASSRRGLVIAKSTVMRRISNNGIVEHHDPVTPRTHEAAETPAAWTPKDYIAESGGTDWRRVRSAILRHRWMIVLVTGAALAGGYAVTKLLLRPQYAVQAMIWIDQDPRRGGDAMPLAANQSFDASAWSDLVRSAQVLDTVVRAKRLNVWFAPKTDPGLSRGFALAPTYSPGTYRLRVEGGQWSLISQRMEVASGALGDSIGTKLGFRWVLPASTPDTDIAFDIVTERDAAVALGEALSVKIGPEGNFLKLGLNGDDPVHIASVLNAVADRYVVVAADLRRQKLREVTTVLGARAAEAAQALRRAEDAFEGHRVRAITQPSDALSSPSARAGDPAAGASSAQYFANQREREGVARARAALERVARTGADADISRIDGLPVVDRDPELAAALKELSTKRAELRTLAYRYSDEYPPVARLREEIESLRTTTVPALAGRLAQSLSERQGQLETDVQKEANELRAMPGRAVEDSRLRRSVEMAQQLYTSLQSRYDAARVADESSLNTVRVLDTAVAPEMPNKNSRNRVMFLALLAGLSLSVAGAVAHDRVDPRVRYPTQVTAEMGLTVLGALPHVPHRRHRDAALDAPMVEALRGVRLNLVYAIGSSGPITITISSPGSSDGKSFLASNLARTFAESGQRTILVDGDLRRGVLHRRLAHQRRPGLADYLLGKEEMSRIIHRTSFDGFDLIPSGTRAVDAPELLGRAATAHLLSTLRSKYDVVICDSPPLSAGIDAFVLGAATGNLVVILRAGVSMREMISSKLDVLDRMPVRLLGAVLNDVRDRTVYNSYSYYLPGYEATDEVKDAKERPPVLL
jgi:succinoglycan biosynthesis transport protein ExoP